VADLRTASLVPRWLPEATLVEIAAESDVYTARARARQLALAMGFDVYAALEIETAVSELAGNVWHHGGGGHVWLRRRGPCLSVTCLDRGPGFAATAARPPRGLGIGLTGAARLMHRLRRGDRPGGGAWVHASRSLEPRAPRRLPAPLPDLDLALAWRSARGEAVSGDGVAVLEEPGPSLLVAVVDGLGHGEGAAEAAATVVQAVGQSRGQPLATILATADEAACRGRGAVAGLLRIHADAVEWAGVGNVALLAWPNGPVLLGAAGYLGMRRTRVHRHHVLDLPPEGLVVLTDGASRAPARAFARPRRARRWAERIVCLADGCDDATAVAIIRRTATA
jgi:anti-sigma regulatory factor (Ser/Thr protein kinase)